MSEHLPSPDDLFDFKRIKRLDEEPSAPEPVPAEPVRRRRVVRDLSGLKAAPGQRVVTEKASEALTVKHTELKQKWRAARKQLGLREGATPKVIQAPPTPAVAPVRVAPVRVAPVHLAPIRSAPARSAPARVAPVRVAPVRAARAARDQPFVVSEPIHQWRLRVIAAGANPQSFFLSAADVVDATRRGAREIAHWMRLHRPGVGWSVDSVELLADVL